MASLMFGGCLSLQCIRAMQEQTSINLARKNGIILPRHYFQWRECWKRNFESSTIVAAPSGNDLLTLVDHFHFGNVVVFNDPMTLDENLNPPHVAKAQGFYFYNAKDTFSAWLAFSLVFNSTDHRGTVNLMGVDPIMGNPDRDISIVGGTGDFFMHRGIATVKMDAFEGDVYFRLKFHLKFYECWQV